MVMKKIALVVALSLGLMACEGAGNNKQTAGTLLGAIGGAVVGSQFGGGKGRLAAVAAGTLLGALAGSEIGKSLDRADRLALQDAAGNALENKPTGSTVAWKNPDSGNSGTITPTKTYQQESGRYCREYQQTIVVGGRSETAYGTACRQPDGSWEIVK